MTRSSLCVALALGCSSSEPAKQPDVQPTVDLWAATSCARLFECAPGYDLRRFEGADAADCARIRKEQMMRALRAPGAASTANNLRACEVQLRTLSCQNIMDLALFDFRSAPACATLDPGGRGNGEACVYSSQCRSGRCGNFEGVCDKCLPFGQEGDACLYLPTRTDRCDSLAGLQCGSNSKCVKTPALGEPCAGGCLGYSVCDSNNKCVPFATTRGAVCEPAANNCDMLGHALVCSRATETCERFESVKRAEFCGLGISSGGMALCEPGAICDMREPTTGNPLSGICVIGHVARAGDPCTPVGALAFESACEGEARCEGGFCRIDDPAACN